MQSPSSVPKTQQQLGTIAVMNRAIHPVQPTLGLRAKQQAVPPGHRQACGGRGGPAKGTFTRSGIENSGRGQGDGQGRPGDEQGM